MTFPDDSPPASPPIMAQDGADLAPTEPAELLSFAVDTVISAWAYAKTVQGRNERRDAGELLAAAMGALIDARRAYREAAE